MRSKVFVLFIALLAVFSTGCTRINPGHVGIVVNMAGSQRGVSDFTPTTGWVFYLPGKTEVFEYPTYVQTAVWTANENEGRPQDDALTFTTKDAMVVETDVNLSYSLEADKIPAFYVKFRSDDLTVFTHGFLRNVARDCFNETAGLFAVEEIMGNNAPFLKQARSCVQERTANFGVHIEQFGIIGAPRPPKGVIDAINMKVQAAQIALQKQNEVMQAEADAKKNVAYAEGDAKARIARAEGESKANQLLTNSLTPSLLEWRKLGIQEQAVTRWNGQRPQVEGSGSGLLLNLTPKQ